MLENLIAKVFENFSRAPQNDKLQALADEFDINVNEIRAIIIGEVGNNKAHIYCNWWDKFRFRDRFEIRNFCMLEAFRNKVKGVERHLDYGDNFGFKKGYVVRINEVSLEEMLLTVDIVQMALNS